MAQATRLLSGWGLKFFDYDNDGALDLFLANGHPDDMIDNYSQQVKYKEPLLLFHQENGQLRNVSAESGPVFAKSLCGARSGHRRFQQRRAHRRAGRQQWRAAAAACETTPGRGITGWE